MPQISFVSVGLAVLDELTFQTKESSQEALVDVIGGAGTYATLGARIFLSPPNSRSVGWMIRAGKDFPSHVQEELEQWNISLFLQKLSDTPSTRASLQYEDSTFGPKQFRYLSPPLTISPAEHLRFTPLLSSTMFHCLASPEDLEELIISLLHTRCEETIDKRPLVIWEPAPPFCVPENLTASICAARLVDVVSPNHIELAALYGEAETGLTASRLEKMAMDFVERGIGPHGEGTIVVRAGELGCFVRSRAQETRWFPPYHAPAVPAASNPVVDPTGAGNAFLGAYSIGLLETGNILEATCYGVVGASFALEQIGLPKLNTLDNGREVWNGVDVRSRLLEYRERANLTVDGRREKEGSANCWPGLSDFLQSPH